MKKCGLLSLMIFLAVACSPSQQSLQLTATQVAQEIYGTQTAMAPTTMIIFTPSLTTTPWPTSTITATPTRTKIPPLPTATLGADGVERMLLCYKAAVVVHADMESFVAITRKTRIVSESARDLANFWLERQSRMKSLFKREFQHPLGLDAEDLNPDQVELFMEYVLVVNNIRLSDEDCAGAYETIADTNKLIEYFSINYTSFSRRMISGNASTVIRFADKHLRESLEIVYGVDPVELNAIADPIWQNVYNRYGVEIP